MKTFIIIGGSRGIGNELVKLLLDNNKIINISRNAPEFAHANLEHFSCDIIRDDLPSLEKADGLVYCPGSINLKPITRLSLDDFREDFEINVLGAVKAIKTYLSLLKSGNSPSIVLFSTVASKLGMPFHASIATAKSGIDCVI